MQDVIIISEMGSVWSIILGRPMLFECMSMSVSNLVRDSELRGSRKFICTQLGFLNAPGVFSPRDNLNSATAINYLVLVRY